MVINKRRNTIQKIKILDYLKGVKSHPTAEVVYKAVVKEIPSITLATCYRNLNKMADSGEILRFEINKELHFDADISLHQHLVCNRCGEIKDVFQKEISQFALDTLKLERFKVMGVHIIYNGFCSGCK